MKNYKQYIISILLVLLITHNGMAQEGSVINGKISDEISRKVISGARVSIKGVKTMTATVTDLDGYYEFRNIIPGKYELMVNYAGYISKKVKNIPQKSGICRVFDIKLSKIPKKKNNGIERINYEKSKNACQDDLQKL